MDSRLQLDSVSGGVEEESNTCSRCVAAAAANRMSCCCCCVAASGELLDGIRKKVRLFSEEEEEEVSRRKMDVSLLREEYRSSREKQKTLTQVLLFRTVSEEPAEAVRIVPVAQGLVSPWEPNTPPPSFDADQKMYDPWHVHLELHRRSHPTGSTQLPHSRHTWSSSSDVGGSQQESRSRKPSSSVSLCSSRETSPCTREKDEARPDSGTSDGSSGGSSRTCGVDQVQSSSEQHLSEDPAEMSAQSSVIIFQGPVDPGPDGGSTCTPSTTSPHLNQEQNQSSESITSKARRGSRFSRQLSIGGMCSSSQNHYPFPSRKTPRISEAARRLGMYSSF
ncbi:uncharacterized protein LOC121628949 [Melanotaenia boesemani]|uniref:uncharacterized protein LOC121628949 n=1 Tax=Melanotaenia boesemani TaxID=1250792 RepID=UPI001C04D257|nr:uncharacterized protein LOC121628949 [Melanotaenia boesemani]